MLYALSGHFRIYLNGIYHEFAAGDFVLINSREVHQIDALSSEGGSYIVVRFLPELIYDGMTQSHFELKYLLPFIIETAFMKSNFFFHIKCKTLCHPRTYERDYPGI